MNFFVLMAGVGWAHAKIMISIQIQLSWPLNHLNIVITFPVGVPGSLNRYRVRDGVPGVLTPEEAVERLEEWLNQTCVQWRGTWR